MLLSDCSHEDFIGICFGDGGTEMSTSMIFLVEVHVEPHKKQLHVTLAYHFPTDHLTSLEKLAKGIEVKLGCDWLAVIFSRDIRFANHEVIF